MTDREMLLFAYGALQALVESDNTALVRIHNHLFGTEIESIPNTEAIFQEEVSNAVLD